MRIRLGALINILKDFLQTDFSVRSAILICDGHVFLADGSPAYTSKMDRYLFGILSDDSEDREACKNIRKCVGIKYI